MAKRVARAARQPAPAEITKKAPACTLVIFGAHGDLTKRLLIPAIYNLRTSNLLDDGFRILGVDRVASDAATWGNALGQMLQGFTQDKSAESHIASVDKDTWNWLAERLSYLEADFSKPEDIARLGRELSGNVIFYLAVASRFFGDIVEQIGNAGLLKETSGVFRRVVIEKPFGADAASARALNARILKQGDEAQFYRIDHFLGKETVQNIMALRFANGIFEPLWRRDTIDCVQITAAETVGVEQRGAFYEATGALRDMVPNHLFQLLAMVAMEPPASFNADAVRSAKAHIIEQVRPLALDDLVRGQYEAGTVNQQKVAAYRREPGVARKSETETYVAMKLSIDNWRWAGVPFYLRTGKRLAGRRTEIVVNFRQAPIALFRDTSIAELTPNLLTFSIQPSEGLSLGISAKRPGPVMKLAGVQMHFSYEEAFERVPNVGYETLIYDCLIGDATLFQRADQIEASWTVVDHALVAAADGKAALSLYRAGSDGPSDADALLRRDGRQWLEISR